MPTRASRLSILFAFLLTMGGILMLPSCYYDVEEELYTGGTCDVTDMSFQLDVLPVLDSKCNSCHNSSSRQGGVALDTYADVSQYAANGRLLGVIQHSAGYSPMPKNEGKLPDCTIARIEAWITDGFPDN